MTNREKAITCLTEWIKTLDNRTLAYVLAYSVDDIVEMGCQHCIYNDKNDICYDTYGDSCHNGIKKWLQQERKE